MTITPKMYSDLIYGLYFGMGILFQAIVFLGGLKKADLKDFAKSIGGGFLMSFIFLIAVGKSDQKMDFYALLIAVYCFYLGFGAAFMMSFKKRILPQMNEISLFTLNTIFIYYLVTRGGFDNFFTRVFLVPTIIGVILILFKTQLKNSEKGFLSFWYLTLLILSGLISIFSISYAPKDHFYSSYLSTFLAGSIFMYVYVFIVYLLMFIPVSEKSGSAVTRRWKEIQQQYLEMISCFKKTTINPFLNLAVFVLLGGILVSNYYYQYISENLLITLIIFFTPYLNAKLSQEVILNNNEPVLEPIKLKKY